MKMKTISLSIGSALFLLGDLLAEEKLPAPPSQIEKKEMKAIQQVKPYKIKMEFRTSFGENKIETKNEILVKDQEKTLLSDLMIGDKDTRFKVYLTVATLENGSVVHQFECLEDSPKGQIVVFQPKTIGQLKKSMNMNMNQSSKGSYSLSLTTYLDDTEELKSCLYELYKELQDWKEQKKAYTSILSKFQTPYSAECKNFRFEIDTRKEGFVAKGKSDINQYTIDETRTFQAIKSTY
jgi:hypothetical protein